MSLFTAETASRPKATPSRTGSTDGAVRSLREAVQAAAEALLDKAHAGRRPWGWGNWSTLYAGHAHLCAELEGDSILSSEYLLMKWILGQENDTPADSVYGRLGGRTGARIANHLRITQRGFGSLPVATEPAMGEPDAGRGGWGQYPGAPTDLSATVKAYFALKLAGDDPRAPHMAAAREVILRMGGAERINTFSMFYLACLGQVGWDACPIIPPQVALLPRWFPFHLDKVAAWTRTMILPLALCTALRPVRRLPSHLGIDELFVDHARRNRLCKDIDRANPAALANTFIVVDRLLKIADRLGLLPLRRRAIRAAERWILERMHPDQTEGLGAIFPPMVYVQVAFRALGYERSHPVIANAERQLDAFMIDAPGGRADRVDDRLDHVRIQPCFSPVWDTGIGLYALTEAGYTAANSARVRGLCDWLLERQVRMNGDWVRNLRPADRGLRLGVDAAAWAFEYRNEWYPDVDDTAMVAKALWRAGTDGDQYRAAAAKACRWILAMQNDDGGWAAFDRTRDRPWMESVPFADHNAMQDPSCPDITGRVLEALITCGVSRDHAAVLAGVRYILEHQRSDGTWFGRWGVNGIYGTWQAVGGLTYAGVPASAPQLQQALSHLRAVQNPDGGFGESANSYLDGAGAAGASTASQTAWALASLLALAGPNDPAAKRAAAFLVRTQLDDVTGGGDPASPDWPIEPPGAWRETWFTGTGFPKVFYLRYHLYRHYFPLMALARFERTGGSISG